MAQKKEFLIADIKIGKLNSLVKNLMKQMGVTDPEEVVRRINSFECRITNWHGSSELLYLNIDSDGTTGYQWIKKLDENCIHIDDYTKTILRSPDFKPTNGVYSKIVLITEKPNNDNGVKSIASERGYKILHEPNPEVACLIIKNFWFLIDYFNLTSIIVAHKPLGSTESYFNIIRHGEGFGLTTSCNIYPHDAIDIRSGVAAAYMIE